MEKEKISLLIRIQNTVRRRLIAGLLVVVPLWVTYVALKYFFRLLDGFFAPLIKRLVGLSIPGLGFLLLIVFVYLVGMVATNILGRALVRFGESLLHRIPIVKNIYQAAKQLVHTLSISKTLGFKRVVLVEYPRQGLRAIAFVTNSITDERTKKRYDVVFIPTTPNPTSGVFELVPEGELTDTTLTIEEGIKMVISGGLVVPKQFSTHSEKPRFPWS